MGKTKVFLKYWHVDKLNELLEKVHKAATVLQSGTYQLALSSAGLLLSGVKGGGGWSNSHSDSCNCGQSCPIVQTAVTHLFSDYREISPPSTHPLTPLFLFSRSSLFCHFKIHKVNFVKGCPPSPLACLEQVSMLLNVTRENNTERGKQAEGLDSMSS